MLILFAQKNFENGWNMPLLISSSYIVNFFNYSPLKKKKVQNLEFIIQQCPVSRFKENDFCCLISLFMVGKDYKGKSHVTQQSKISG